MALRDEIMRIKAEREQVALRMDAIRIQHEADARESKVGAGSKLFTESPCKASSLC
jgi:hypothetical protein